MHALGPAPGHGSSAAIAKVRFIKFGGQTTLKSSASPAFLESMRLSMTRVPFYIWQGLPLVMILNSGLSEAMKVLIFYLLRELEW